MPRYSNWYTGYFCINCNKKLSYHTVMYSNGRCPICGHKGKNAGTIIDTVEKAVRKVYHKPWYIFWQKPTIEIK
jgi:DNA-directed RNA polymerase subunit RPC12/RpoP